MTSVPVPPSTMRVLLPARGTATVKSVMSGDTVVLLGRPAQMGGKAPEVVFTFEKVSAPRLAHKSNGNVDEPGAHTSRMWLRELVVGKTVSFETRKQGATAGDRVYGVLLLNDGNGEAPKNLAVESVRLGLSTPKLYANESEEKADDAAADMDPYESALMEALREAKNKCVGIHDESKRALVRVVKNANDGDFDVKDLVAAVQSTRAGTVKVLIEYVFDGSRLRVQVTDDKPEFSAFQYGAFTMILGGVLCPRVGNSKAEPPTPDEPLSREARSFVELRLLNRELEISLHGAPENMQATGIGTIHHPKGDISLELLKRGLARIADWSLRVLLDAPKGCMSGVMQLRKMESDAKNSKHGIWKDYVAPAISGEQSFEGQVVEVSSGDTLLVLPMEETYDSEDKLRKISLSSIRAPRVGNERAGRVDEPYACESKDRLRVLTAGKTVKITIDYERDIPLAPGESEKRQYATITGKKGDVGEILVSEGLAITQRHRDDEEKSPRYGELCAAENNAKVAKKGIHNSAAYNRRTVNDLVEPRKAKTYASSLQRAGTMKGLVEYVFNGCRFKIFIPKENCSCAFTLDDVRCPQPSPLSDRDQRKAEPFGDEAKRFSRLKFLQRNVELVATGVTNGGVITGQIYITTSEGKRSLSEVMLKEGLGYIDQRLLDFGKASTSLVDLQEKAKSEKIGLWSLVQEEEVKIIEPAKKATERTTTLRISEIRCGNHFFFTVDDEAVNVIADSMKIFTSKYGTNGAPCDLKKGKVVAALFDDGSGKSWYRARILDRAAVKGKVSVLFIDHGNITNVSIATHLRPLDAELLKIPPVAKEAQLALTIVPGIDEEDGVNSARELQYLGWGKSLSAKVFCEIDGKFQIVLFDMNGGPSLNEEMVAVGLAKLPKGSQIASFTAMMQDPSGVNTFVEDMKYAQEEAKKRRSGMWRYGDVGEYDDDDM